MTAEDADVVEACGTLHRVTVQVHRVPEEVDLAIPHLRADEDGLCGVRVEVGETSGTFYPLGQGAEVASVTREPLGVVHEEHSVQLPCGGHDGRDVAAGFVALDLPVDAVLHARHRAPLPRAGS